MHDHAPLTVASRRSSGEAAVTASPSDAAFSEASATELLELARCGNQAAWHHLYQRFRAPLRHAAERRLPRSVRGVADSDDVVQDVFLNACRHLERLELPDGAAFLSYLRRAVVNRVIDEVRRASRGPTIVAMPTDVVSSGRSPLQHAIRRDQFVRYRAALARLSPRDQHLVRLRFENGGAYRDVAAALGLTSPDVARIAAMRAMRRLERLVCSEPVTRSADMRRSRLRRTPDTQTLSGTASMAAVC